MADSTTLHIREMEPHEAPYLRRAAYLSIHAGDGPPPPEDIVDRPVFRRTWEAWGRRGDIAVVAAVAPRKLVGAAWVRRYTEREPTYGYVAPEIPALDIALEPEYRGAGMGTRLMRELIRLAGAAGYDGISLSVDPDNRAMAFYRRLGFTEISGPRIIEDDRNPVMLLDLRSRGSHA